MKKGNIICFALAGCIALGGVGFGLYSATPTPFRVNASTTYLQLEKEINKGNYSVVAEVDVNNPNTYRQVAYYYDGTTSYQYSAQMQNGFLNKKEVYTFQNYENNELMQYQIIVTNYQFNPLTMQFDETPAPIIYHAGKTLVSDLEAEDSSLRHQITRLNALEKTSGPLKVKPDTGAQIAILGDGTLITSYTASSSSVRSHLFDIGTTSINLPQIVVEAALDAAPEYWVYSEETRPDFVMDTQNGYTAYLTNRFWDTNTIAYIPETFNTLPVENIVVNDTYLSTYQGRAIVVFMPSDNGRIKGQTGKFKYDFTRFVEQGGLVAFTDVIFQNPIITDTTDLQDLLALVEARNFTSTLTETTIDPLGNKSIYTEKTLYQGKQHIAEYILETGGEKYIENEYGIWVGGQYYTIRFSNYDASGNIYQDGQMRYSYYNDSLPFEQAVNFGKEFISKLQQNLQTGKVTVKEDPVLGTTADYYVHNGIPTIRGVIISSEEAGTYNAYGEVVITLSSITTTVIEMPQFVINKILELDPSNPLNNQIIH